MKLSTLILSFLLALTLLSGKALFAQEPVKPAQATSPNLEDKIEQLSEKTDSELDYSDVVDELMQYVRNPININQASERELMQLQLNDLQIYNLTTYIQKFGELTSPFELNMIEGFDSTLVTNLAPFITFELKPYGTDLTLKNMLNYGKHQIITRYQQVLQEQKGYSPIDDSSYQANPNSRYLGGPEKIYLRYGYSFYNKIRFGVTMEKDAGETFFPKSDTLKKGFDFYSFHFYYTGKKFLKHFALGDYHVQFGQGLTMTSSLGFGKSTNAITNRRIAQAVKPSAGANENLFMRGAAATVTPFKNTDLTLFYSSKKVDANVEGTDSLSSEDYYISSLQESGYHRTPNELSNKDAIDQTVYGGNLQTRLKMFRLGATAVHTELGNELQRSEELYNKFDFRGKSLTNVGFDYAVILKSLTLFGEISGSDNGGKAILAGATATPDPRLALSLIYRNYSKDYQNLYSNAFAEGSRNSNEKGIYVGILAQLHKRVSLSAYADYFTFPWLRYRVDAPSHGKEYLTQLTYTPSRRTQILFRYRYQQKQLNPSEPGGYTVYPEPETKQNFRIDLNFKPNEIITLKTRLETTDWQMPGFEKRNGFLIYQDLAYNHPEKPWQINTRFALFDTDTYNERLYAYESDVLYAFSIPSYYYKGSRFYLMGKYSFGRNLDIWIRYSITYYANQQIIGSGLDEIQGNKKSEVKIQLRLRL
ncbi:MAG: helix-hairpin-helix domain-containing protein [Lentimicrobium sp.]|nr:helix-hairpin-helix domain-containing protein [Lentimicrobium sp.]